MRERRPLDELMSRDKLGSFDEAVAEVVECAKDFIQAYEEERETGILGNTALRMGVLAAACANAYEWTYKARKPEGENEKTSSA